MITFKKILIANRGEIARRIIRTCKRMGIESVCVYSDADVNAPFVKEADQSVRIGPPQAKESYLCMDNIIEAALNTKAEAIHPGYGFLSENALFAQKCIDAGLVFIGPSPQIIDLMGSKIEARKLMKHAGVPVVPGWDGKLESVEEALSIAKELGYPLMLKASAGGGGIGMQRIFNEDELRKAFLSTIQKATTFFGDGTVYLEKLIEDPHHIEVQIAFDQHGNGVHLFERECSIQRRNQKVIEESPSPFLNDIQRQKLYETALRGAKEIGYSNVGTMEFIFDKQGDFYFLEMNTRLQVEHPVTEMVTGLDLVELQIQIAFLQPLPFQQGEIQSKGHAIECRLYAENPKTFMPSPGKITKLYLPEEKGRFDFGVVEGDTVSPFYDPMIGKIISSGGNRLEAIYNLKNMLKDIQLEGVMTNLSLLSFIAEEEDFLKGNYTTGYLNQKAILT